MTSKLFAALRISDNSISAEIISGFKVLSTNHIKESLSGDLNPVKPELPALELKYNFMAILKKGPKLLIPRDSVSSS